MAKSHFSKFILNYILVYVNVALCKQYLVQNPDLLKSKHSFQSLRLANIIVEI